ncbi:hypothetical protein HOLleu_26154 [Holothuria leucospilota]|uniref:Uncharacterized protein n=1 Tax=Holothuria leucospilota TaxID=206669 RepID=A0A9Q1H2B2_HOLLE|nr:hypothetical protein HOLleu_26154 [Holothuria leucospilota]
MENLMCTEGAPRARSASPYAWGPGARVRAPGGSRGRSPRKLLQYCILRAQKSAPVLMSVRFYTFSCCMEFDVYGSV